MNKLLSLYRSAGPVGAAITILERALRPRPAFLSEVRSWLAGAHAVEFGGPSARFMPDGLMPVYDVLSSIDNVTFAPETIWEGRILKAFEPLSGIAGRQHIADATCTGAIGPYDAVLSCHVIEHLANPIKGLKEWHRILRSRGWLVLLAPHGRYSFDRKRPLTRFEHIIGDFERDATEGDRTHVNEVLALHDIPRDPGLNGRDELERRLADNVRLRTMHHHVFDERLVRELLQYAGFHVEHLVFRRPFDIIAVARKD